MKRFGPTAITFVGCSAAALALCLALEARGQEAAVPEAVVESRSLFEAAMQLQSAGGETKFNVAVRRRNLPRGARFGIPAGPGLTVVQLLAGKVQVSSGGRTEKPAVDSFWVAGGATESVIESTSEAALIETFEATPAR